MTPIAIRHATDQEAELAAAIIRAAFAEQASVRPPSGAILETGASLAERMARGGTLIAELAGQPAGCVCYETHADHAHFGRLAVLPAHRGRGIARALVEAVEQLARERGYQRISLGVRTALHDNRAWYARRGYQFVAARSHEGYSEPTWEIWEKMLGTSEESAKTSDEEPGKDDKDRTLTQTLASSPT